MARPACRLVLALSLPFLPAQPALAGPYTEPGHAISEMVDWASEVEAFARGPLDIANPSGGNASHGAPEVALGPVAGVDTLDVVALGDGGSITLWFESGIADGPGDDFAVFENSFFNLEGLFAELAFVEVSSNGTDFARFDPVTLVADPIWSFGSLDPTDVHNLAGKHPMGQGTGFDLAELEQHPLVSGDLLDLADVRYVRLVDVVGNGSTFDAQSPAHPVWDPYPTPFPAGGFDVQGVGVLHAVPEPGVVAGLAACIGWLGVLSRRRGARRQAR
jgi:hypothetical protein